MNYLFLSKTELFKGISENDLENIIKCLGATEKKFKKSETIYTAGCSVTDIGLVLSGSVNIIVNHYWGSSNILGHISPGQIFAETYAIIPGKELLCDVVANEETSVLFINADKVITVCRSACSFHNTLIRNLLKIAAQKNLNLSVRMMHTAPKFIRDRLLSYFSEQSLIAGTMHFTIPFSRQQLADYLGVERSALSNELSKMKRDGLIYYNKNSFTLLSDESITSG